MVNPGLLKGDFYFYRDIPGEGKIALERVKAKGGNFELLASHSIDNPGMICDCGMKECLHSAILRGGFQGTRVPIAAASMAASGMMEKWVKAGRNVRWVDAGSDGLGSVDRVTLVVSGEKVSSVVAGEVLVRTSDKLHPVFTVAYLVSDGRFQKEVVQATNRRLNNAS